MVARRVVVTAQRMANKHRVIAGCVEFAVGLEDQFVVIKRGAAVELKWLGEGASLGCYQADAIVRKSVWHELWARLRRGARGAESKDWG